MYNPAPQSAPAAAAAAASSSSVPSVDDLKAKIPLLQKMNQDDPRFIMLRELLTEMAAIKYDPQRKEEMMYKAIKIDSLLGELLLGTNPESAVESLEKYKDKIEVTKMNDVEQRALFVLYRNIFADFSHFLNDDEIKQHLEGFSLLCNGIAHPAALSEVKSDLTCLTRSNKLKQILEKEDASLHRTNKLLCQAGYYLLKAQELASKGDIYGSCMALVSAGNCARFFHYSGANKGKPVRITETFLDLRNELVHERLAGSNAERIMAAIRERFEKIETYIKTLQNEAKGLEIDVNVTAYIAQNSSAASSPQTFDRRFFEQKDREKESERESQVERKGDKKIERERDHDVRNERESRGERYRAPYLNSSSSSAMPSSSSSYSDRRRDDDSRRDRERDRDRERGRDYGGGYRRPDDRRYESPPRSSYGSSSSSRYGGEPRDDRYSSSSARTYEPPLDQRQPSQSARAAAVDEDEEERRLRHDKKKTRGSSEGCRDEDPRYGTKDDSDDESRRHEKRPPPQQSSLGSSVSSSSTQRSSTHSERRSSSSYTGSSSHSDVRHESSSLSAHYGSGLGRPKDWSGVERGKHDSQPEKPLVTESFQPARAKKERPQSEEETPREEQNIGLKRRF